MAALTPFDEGYVAPEPVQVTIDLDAQPFPDKPAATRTRARAAASPKPAAHTRRAPVEDDDEQDLEPEPEIQHPKEIADGIYFGMLDDAYHAIERLSSSGMQNMLVSPATFWVNSWLNHHRVDRPLKSRIVGRAYHAARLEPALFEKNYVRAPAKSDMPKGTLFTGPDMGAALEALGAPKSGSVREQANRLREWGYRGSVWQWALADWEAAQAGRMGLAADVYDDIAEDMKRIHSSPQIAALLSDGAAEVSVFWTCPRTKIPMKARLDYLKPLAWVDFKTFDNTRGKRLEQAIADAFRYNRYYVQAVAYRDAVEAIRNGLVDIVGECATHERDIVDAIQLSPGPLDCFYVFQEKGGVPNIVARRFKFDELPALHTMHAAGLDERRAAAAAREVARPTGIMRKATVEIEHAKRLYLGYSEIYEPGDPWLPIEPVSDIGDEDFNSFWLEGRGE
jgi:hypothetical protein